MTTLNPDILRRVADGTERMVSDLQQLIRQPSVSAKGEGLAECARLVSTMLEKSGLDSEILYLGEDISVPPVVYGEVQSRSNPDKTLLFYNHYDVQPAEPFDLWSHPPFEGVRKGNRVFGRGAADDKGELVARMHAVEAFLHTTGDVPCNIKFVIEGEEEIGSHHMGQYLDKYKSKFACDGIIWEFGYVDANGRPIISLGMKGLMFVELAVRGPARDAHSSLAVIIPNPAWRLVEALGTMRAPSGRITISGWYDEVRPFTRTDMELLESEEFDESMFKEEFGLDSLLGGRSGLEARKVLAGEPTCNIAGLTSGYAGKGAKTVLPAVATAKLDFRLVPDMVPTRQFARIQAHLASRGFGDIDVAMVHGESAARTSPSERLVSDVNNAAGAAFGVRPVMNVSNPATGPMASFARILNAPCVAVGGTYVYSRIHSPDEFARIDLLEKTADCMCRIMDNFGFPQVTSA